MLRGNVYIWKGDALGHPPGALLRKKSARFDQNGDLVLVWFLDAFLIPFWGAYFGRLCDALWGGGWLMEGCWVELPNGQKYSSPRTKSSRAKIRYTHFFIVVHAFFLGKVNIFGSHDKSTPKHHLQKCVAVSMQMSISTRQNDRAGPMPRAGVHPIQSTSTYAKFGASCI